MSEDYTYTTPTDWRRRIADLEAQLNAAILGQRELEAKVRELAQTNGRLASANTVLRRENAELRAKLGAVPVPALLYMIDPFANGGVSQAASEAHWLAIEAWAQAEKAKQEAS